ncbi:MAG: ABC transporter permease DevC [Gemmataceae bacterium]
MPLTKRVPVAWLNLTHSVRRFLLSVLGISFAVVLMLVELGFWRALLDSQTALINSVDADLFLVPASMSTITDGQTLPLTRIDQARAVPGVGWAQPLYLRDFPFVWKNREDVGVLQWPIRVIAFQPDPAHPAFREDRMPGFAASQALLRPPRTALLDERSKSVYDAVKSWRDGGPPPIGVEREIGGKTVRIVGFFRLGTDFTTDGNLLMSAENLPDFLPEREPLQAMTLGLVKLADGADPGTVREAVRRVMPPDTRVLTRSELAGEETGFWTNSTPVGFIFTLGLAVGFIVGVVICYQILSTEVTDHLAEFATLKAIGYHDRYIAGVVLQEALLLSLLGFAAGLALGWPLYLVLQDKTGLPMTVTLGRAGLILALTVLMCVVSGFLALRRVRTADPAEVFG